MSAGSLITVIEACGEERDHRSVVKEERLAARTPELLQPLVA
jgi:hypothetical protein